MCSTPPLQRQGITIQPLRSEQTMLVSNSRDLPTSAYQVLRLEIYATMLSSTGSSFEEPEKYQSPRLKHAMTDKQCQSWSKTGRGLEGQIYTVDTGLDRFRGEAVN